ncbi:MAG: hypothetical protein PHH16_03275 [Candidatus Gracilibacteria bacterium]|nr:hypothetical protein [Candidatus Gracilibacteria bacterium]
MESHALAMALVIGLGLIGAGIGLGLVGSGAMEAIGRNPNAKKSLIIEMFLFLGVIEALAIFGIAMAFVIK